MSNQSGCSPCAIALGGNVGDVAATFEWALAQLTATPGVQVQRRSRWYRTPAMGPPQPDYLNGCVLLVTELAPEALLAVLQGLEAAAGRSRQVHWGPRTLDLDVVLWGEQGQTVITSDRLTVPHPGLCERAFVLVPLAEIAPNWRDPHSGQAIAELVQQVNASAIVPMIDPVAGVPLAESPFSPVIPDQNS